MRTILIFLTAASAWGTTLRVPSQYATIQAALDSLADGDTVLVALGTYAEELLAPAHAFALKGDVPPDTGDYPRPVVDPSTLSQPTTRSCLRLPQSSVPVIEDFRFRNGEAMYPHSGLRSGGVQSSCDLATFRRCVFDSTAGGYAATPGACFMEGCQFLDIQGACVSNLNGSLALIATDCSFHGRALFNIYVYDHSHFLRCHFGGNPSGSLCLVSGRDVRIEGCIFGPSLPGEASWDPALCLNAASGWVQGNLFEGLRLGNAAISVNCVCNDGDEIVVRNNHFINNSVDTDQGTVGIDVFCGDNHHQGRCLAQLDSNLFDSNTGNILTFESLSLRTDARVTHNRFRRLPRNNVPTVLVWPRFDSGLLEGYELRGNLFDTTRTAVVVDHALDTLDARWNWWGDSTGPYNAASNPGGRGDTVSDWVDFIPWCTDTIVCEEPTAARDRFIPHPSFYRLSAYPNPFNSTTIIRLEVPQPEIVRLETYDILGRRVRELWAGVVADEKEMAFDGSGLASGVYFVRATDTIWNRPLISAKVVLLR